MKDNRSVEKIVSDFTDRMVEKENDRIKLERKNSDNLHIKNSKWVTVFITGAVLLIAWIVFSVAALLFAAWWWKSLIVSVFMFLVWMFIGNMVDEYYKQKGIQ